MSTSLMRGNAGGLANETFCQNPIVSSKQWLSGLKTLTLSVDLLSKAMATHPFNFYSVYKIVKKEGFHNS